MKLKAAQLKKMPDSDFGLIDKNGKRSFPMPDKQHVLLAIKMFKYCPKGKEKELASKINQKAREYKMKIHAKGAFMKYISSDVMSLSKEASNVGTLEPIVAGNEYQEIQIPALKERATDNDKILALIANRKIKNTVHTTTEGFKEFTWDIDSNYKDYFESIYNSVEDYHMYPTNESYIKIYSILESNMELLDEVEYVTSSYTNDFSDRVNYISDISHYIEETMKDPKILEVSKCNLISHLISNTLDNDRVLYYLLIVNKLDTSRTLIKKIVKNLLIKHYNQFDSLYTKQYFDDDFDNSKYSYNMRYKMDNILNKLETFVYNNHLQLNIIHEDVIKYYENTNNYFSLLQSDIHHMYAMILEQLRDKCDISGYYIKEFQNKIYAFCTFSNTSDRLYRLLLMYKKNDLVLIAYDTNRLKEPYMNVSTLYTREINCNELLLKEEIDNSFFTGIYLSPDGSICLDIFNRLFINKYSDLELLLSTDLDIKANLCYLFSMIVLIYNRFVFNKKYDKSSKDYLDILSFKKILEEKFKSIFMAIRKNDQTFNFLEYYKTNDYMHKIHIADNNGLYNLDSIYTKLIRF